MIKLNKIGKVIKGEYPDWYIVIIDERENDKVNGILIFQSDNIEFNGLTGGIVYDDWVKDLEQLENFFSEPEWEINWLEIKNPIKTFKA